MANQTYYLFLEKSCRERFVLTVRGEDKGSKRFDGWFCCFVHV